uniref:Uncharacterized protein n=1 Tax=Ananas comosus var. bracteatus TaxID=296719 RepID=A0A6V7PXR3_ANACO|nr:unnamed protein product [Ananas comosus var. bracteatus]
MARTKSIYRAIGEQLSILDIFFRLPTMKAKSAPTISADEQIAMLSDLATKVVALSDDMKTILDWIKAQSAAPSAMPVEKSSRLSGTPPPKACVTLMKGTAEDTSGVGDDDNSANDGSIVPSLVEGMSQPFKVESKVEIPNYDGAVDTEK